MQVWPLERVSPGQRPMSLENKFQKISLSLIFEYEACWTSSISRRKSFSIPILALGNKTVAVHWHCCQNDEYIELKYIVNCLSDYHGVLLGRLYGDGRWCQVWRLRRPDGLGNDPGHHCMHCGHSNIRHLQNRGNLNC